MEEKRRMIREGVYELPEEAARYMLEVLLERFSNNNPNHDHDEEGEGMIGGFKEFFGSEQDSLLESWVGNGMEGVHCDPTEASEAVKEAANRGDLHVECGKDWYLVGKAQGTGEVNYHNDVRFSDLVRSGLVVVGQEMVFEMNKRKRFTARVVDEEGTLEWSGMEGGEEDQEPTARVRFTSTKAWCTFCAHWGNKKQGSRTQMCGTKHVKALYERGGVVEGVSLNELKGAHFVWAMGRELAVKNKKNRDVVAELEKLKKELDPQSLRALGEDIKEGRLVGKRTGQEQSTTLARWDYERREPEEEDGGLERVTEAELDKMFMTNKQLLDELGLEDDEEEEEEDWEYDHGWSITPENTSGLEEEEGAPLDLLEGVPLSELRSRGLFEGSEEVLEAWSREQGESRKREAEAYCEGHYDEEEGAQDMAIEMVLAFAVHETE